MKQIVFAANPELRGREKYMEIFRSLRNFWHDKRETRKGSAPETIRTQPGLSTIFTIKMPRSGNEHLLEVFCNNERNQLSLVWLISHEPKLASSSSMPGIDAIPASAENGIQSQLRVLKALAGIYGNGSSEGAAARSNPNSQFDMNALCALGEIYMDDQKGGPTKKSGDLTFTEIRSFMKQK